MKITELEAAARSANDRHLDIVERGKGALTAMVSFRAGLRTAQQAHDAALQALDTLADGHVAGTSGSEGDVAAALRAVDSAAFEVRVSQALVGAAERAVASLQAAQAAAVAERDEKTELAKRTAFHARVLALAEGQA